MLDKMNKWLTRHRLCCCESKLYLQVHKMHGQRTNYPFTWITHKRELLTSLQIQISCLLTSFHWKEIKLNRWTASQYSGPANFTLHFFFTNDLVLLQFENCSIQNMPVPVAARSEALVYGRSPAAIVGSNPGARMFVCCECCVLSGRGPCDGLITRPEESYRLWRVVCDHETS